MKITAEQLEMDLKILYPDKTGRTIIKELAINEIENDKPDYLILPFLVNISKEILDCAEKNKVYTFAFNSDIPERDKNVIGKVGEKYKYWIGHIYPDDEYAGYILAKELINEAKKRNYDKKINIIGLSGSFDSSVANNRNKGLKKAVREENNTIINQIFYTNWKYSEAYLKTSILINRYPETNIIWGAGDFIALGGYNSIKKINPKKINNIIFGGIDWSNIGLEATDTGIFTTTVGGHFFEGVLVLIMIKDHSMGIDIGKFPIKTKMKIITKENINYYRELISYDNFKKLNIKKLSKYYNPKLKEYNFDIIEVLKNKKNYFKK
ncbi:ABC transporter substrate-binding protein [Hypnocyclicus thermotrophus]|nr:ABC transporter substrate-binding protein [Hypnocyclicus thermotrophus]